VSKKLGRNESCWCGSGKKFKKCHLNREHEPMPTFEEGKKLYKSLFKLLDKKSIKTLTYA